VSFESVESSDESSSDEPFAVHWLEASSQAKPPNWLVTNVLETGQIALLIAEENTGKTFCAMDLAMHIGAGARWMGNDVVRNPVLYVSGEGANGFRRRLAAIETHKPWLADADVQVRLEALTLTAKGEAGALVPGVDMRRMVKAVRASGAKFVVIDTLSANKGSADENSNDDIAYMLKQLRKRFDMAGVDSDMSILIVHHTTKDGQSWRGASALSNNTDVRFELRQAMRGEQDLGYKELTTPRQRDAVTAAMAFRLTPVVLMGEGMETFSSCIVTEVEQELRDEQDYAAQCRERWEVLSALPEYWDNPLNLRAFRPPGMLERECTNLLAKFVHKGFVQEVVDRGRKRYRCTELGTEKVVYYQRFAQT
jgi:hypothetical protein